MGSVSKAESRVAGMVLVMVAMFLVAWTPYAAFALIVAFGEPGLISPATAVLPAVIAKSSICYNPLIYVGLNTQVRLFSACVFKVSSRFEKSATFEFSQFNPEGF